MPRWGILRMTRFRIVTLSMSWFCARKAAWVESLAAHPEPSRMAPYSPTKVSPVFGEIELVIECTPARRQYVVPADRRLMTCWIELPGQMSTAPEGQVMLAEGPYVMAGAGAGAGAMGAVGAVGAV